MSHQEIRDVSQCGAVCCMCVAVLSCEVCIALAMRRQVRHSGVWAVAWRESYEILPGIRYSCVLQCVVLQCVVLQCLGSGLAESSEILPGIRYVCVLQCVVLQCVVLQCLGSVLAVSCGKPAGI